MGQKIKYSLGYIVNLGPSRAGLFKKISWVLWHTGLFKANLG